MKCSSDVLIIVAALLEKDVAVFDQLSSGELMSALSGDVQEVRLAIRHAVSMGVRSTTQVFNFR